MCDLIVVDAVVVEMLGGKYVFFRWRLGDIDVPVLLLLLLKFPTKCAHVVVDVVVQMAIGG